MVVSFSNGVDDDSLDENADGDTVLAIPIPLLLPLLPLLMYAIGMGAVKADNFVLDGGWGFRTVVLVLSDSVLE